ncbi:MAG: hypothetical protein ACRD1Z_00130, partial [Vicinamibacteria bacterium]
DGRYRIEEADLPPRPLDVRARRVGYEDVIMPAGDGAKPVELKLASSQAIGEQLPANVWFGRLQFPDRPMKEEFARQCGFCHQQGSSIIRNRRTKEEWEAVFDRMRNYGGILTARTREAMPQILMDAWGDGASAKSFAVPEPPSDDALGAVITEYDLGDATSCQHDVEVGPDGNIWSVDTTNDNLYRLNPKTFERKHYRIPANGSPLYGVFASGTAGMITGAGNDTPHVAPHSIQRGPDGRLWLTLCLGNKIASFDPASESFEFWKSPGYYPHTLRWEGKKIWYTLAISNHVARFDTETKEFETIRLPADGWYEGFVSRTVGFWIWMQKKWPNLVFKLAGRRGAAIPTPYG